MSEVTCRVSVWGGGPTPTHTLVSQLSQSKMESEESSGHGGAGAQPPSGETKGGAPPRLKTPGMVAASLAQRSRPSRPSLGTEGGAQT